MKVRFFAIFCFVCITPILSIAQKKEVIDCNTLPEAVTATIKKEYADRKYIEKCQLDDKGRYRLSMAAKGEPMEVMVTEADGKWIRKAHFVNMTEADLVILMQIQDIAGSVDNVKYWTKTLFPDGTVEFRVAVQGQLYAWDANLKYLGAIKNEMLPGKPDNIKKPKA